MTTDQWLIVVGIAVSAVLAVTGGIVGWMVSVASSLSSIDEATKGIVTTLGEHSERIEDLGLKVNTLQVQFGVHDARERKSMGS